MLNDIVGCYVQLTSVRCSAQRIKYVVMFKGQSRRWSSMDRIGCDVQLTSVRCSAQRIKYVVMFKGQSRRWYSMDRIGCDVQKAIGQKWRWMIKGCLIKIIVFLKCNYKHFIEGCKPNKQFHNVKIDIISYK
jgi:hypothetical protein